MLRFILPLVILDSLFVSVLTLPLQSDSNAGVTSLSPTTLHQDSSNSTIIKSVTQQTSKSENIEINPDANESSVKESTTLPPSENSTSTKLLKSAIETAKDGQKLIEVNVDIHNNINSDVEVKPTTVPTTKAPEVTTEKKSIDAASLLNALCVITRSCSHLDSWG